MHRTTLGYLLFVFMMFSTQTFAGGAYEAGVECMKASLSEIPEAYEPVINDDLKAGYVGYAVSIFEKTDEVAEYFGEMEKKVVACYVRAGFTETTADSYRNRIFIVSEQGKNVTCKLASHSNFDFDDAYGMGFQCRPAGCDPMGKC